jgi:hypothetical protein
MWRWVSTKPGITTHLLASITCAFGALMFGFTAEIFLPSMRMSACSKSPAVLSSVRTQPPLIRIGRPAWPPSALRRDAASASPITLVASTGATATPAAVVQRNCRRDRPALGRQHGQPELDGCIM